MGYTPIPRVPRPVTAVERVKRAYIEGRIDLEVFEAQIVDAILHDDYGTALPIHNVAGPPLPPPSLRRDTGKRVRM